MLPVIQVGPLSIQAEGLFYILGIWIAMSLAGRYAHLFKLQSEKLDTLVLIALAAGIVGARLTYLLRYRHLHEDAAQCLFTESNHAGLAGRDFVWLSGRAGL